MKLSKTQKNLLKIVSRLEKNLEILEKTTIKEEEKVIIEDMICRVLEKCSETLDATF